MFRNYYSSLEARDLVTILFEDRHMSFSNIGRAIGKSQNTIIAIYNGEKGVHKNTLDQLRILESLPRYKRRKNRS